MAENKKLILQPPSRGSKRRLEVNVALTPSGVSDHSAPPALRRLTTPDCMSSPVSHLRDLTRDLEEDGAKRRRAAQYLRESRLAHLQQRRLVLVLDLDETLVHSLRGSVRQIGKGKKDPQLDPSQEEDDGEEGDGEEEEPAAGPGPLPGGQPAIGPLPTPGAGGAAGSDAAGSDAGEDDAGREVTLQVQNVEFEMKLRPGVHAFLREMSTLFCVHLYTMGSREYVQQALHHLDPNHEIFKPGQVLAWNPALDRTTKTLQRLLCVPELVLIVDDSPIAWANHLPNLVLIDRFVGAPSDTSLERVGHHLREIHRTYFERAGPLPTPSLAPSAPPGTAASLTSPPPLTLPAAASTATAPSAAAANKRVPPLPSISESSPPQPATRRGERRSRENCGVSSSSSGLPLGGTRTTPRSPLISSSHSASPGGEGAEDETVPPQLPIASRRPSMELALGRMPSNGELSVGGESDSRGPSPVLQEALAGAPPAGPPVAAKLIQRERDTAAESAAAACGAAAADAVAATSDDASGAVTNGTTARTNAGPDVRDLLLTQCSDILGNVDCAFVGPSDLLVVDGVAPPEVQLARRFGANIRGEVSATCTHLLVPPALLAEGTLICERTEQLVNQARSHSLEPSVHVVDARWLLDCVSKWQRLPEADYELPFEVLEQPLVPTLAQVVPTSNPWANKK